MSIDNLPEVGRKIEATKLISYTLDEFEDNPLVLQPGDQGTVTLVNPEKNAIEVEWNNDPNKHLKKAIYTGHESSYKTI